MYSNMTIKRAARLAVGALLAASMNPFGLSTAIAAPTTADPGTAGCYGNMQHEGEPNPAKCGIGGVATPSTLAPGVPNSTVSCVPQFGTLSRPVLPSALVASLDVSVGRGAAANTDSVQVATKSCCSSSELGAPVFSTFDTASLDTQLVVPQSAVFGKAMLLAEPNPCGHI